MSLSPQLIQRSQSLHEQAYAVLRTSILSGELAPGERLIETQLAAWLQVSRTPLREALRQLQREGLVTADASAGLRVTTISTTDAIQLYDCRLALERLSVAEASTHINPGQLERLEEYVVKAEKLLNQPPQKQNFLQLLDLDYQFHRLIAESSGNRRLVFLLEQVFDAMSLLRIQTLQHNPGVLDIRLEHRQIYNAIAHHNAEAAIAAITTHLSASKSRVVQEIESLQQPQAT